MKIALTDMIPEGAQIELSDVGYLFYRYIMQTTKDTPPDPEGATYQWIERMNDVLLEEWGVGIDFRTWLQ